MRIKSLASVFAVMGAVLALGAAPAHAQYEQADWELLTHSWTGNSMTASGLTNFDDPLGSGGEQAGGGLIEAEAFANDDTRQSDIEVTRGYTCTYEWTGPGTPANGTWQLEASASYSVLFSASGWGWGSASADSSRTNPVTADYNLPANSLSDGFIIGTNVGAEMSGTYPNVTLDCTATAYPGPGSNAAYAYATFAIGIAADNAGD